ncbi:hypothetical protein HMPREF9016_00087 [Neisseria sp. oral taxon 014 str. F0314]|uniref:hypothetical protein n=1 Tax=Neisseria sp. oral taxon 014 TaxID=641148 RepID=UPI0001D8C7E0|nr:hypothetical protein [Neisseria sp. oral taxon 014]EFI23914.1 hypothetical protein HMPREF9016_00087 [Neisseria sp. oral taxon 014 str. F0314]
MPVRSKEFHEYILNHGCTTHVGHNDYLIAPASAFLKYTIETKDAVQLCIDHFPKKQDGNYKKASADALQHFVQAMLPTVMGHFETYQRYLFAGAFERSVYLKEFDISNVQKNLRNATQIDINFSKLAAYRNFSNISVGFLLADAMNDWHNPNSVNSYFKIFTGKGNIYEPDVINKLKVLWQLRHSIVHTGGTLTQVDSQKVLELNTFGDKYIFLEKQFTFELARKFHKIVKASTNTLKTAFMGRLISNISKVDRDNIEKFFEVKSSCHVWLR